MSNYMNLLVISFFAFLAFIFSIRSHDILFFRWSNQGVSIIDWHSFLLFLMIWELEKVNLPQKVNLLHQWVLQSKADMTSNACLNDNINIQCLNLLLWNFLKDFHSSSSKRRYSTYVQRVKFIYRSCISSLIPL